MAASNTPGGASPSSSHFGRRQRGLISSVTGPILMIVTGILFAIAYNGGPHFGRTWPVIVIVVGLLRLLEYLGSRPQDYPGSNSPGAPGA
jgi:hypothetical protein